MSKISYEGAKEFKPISAWGYVGYTILFAIPVIGFILMIIFSFSKKNINRRNFARQFWCYLLIAVILLVGSIALTRVGVGDLTKPLKQWSPQIRQVIESIENIIPAGKKDAGLEAAGAAKSLGTMEKSTGVQSKATEKPAAVQRGASLGVRKEVKDAIDGYEAFFKEYAAFMKKYSSSSNPLGLMADYTKMMGKYAENLEAWEKFEKKYSDMNDAEMKYYLDATVRIEKILMSVL